jgi:hypothetical protein
MTTVSQLLSKVGIDTSDVPAGLQGFQQAMIQGVGTATQQAQLRIDALSDRITFQKRQLDIHGRALIDTARAHGENSVQVQRSQLSYDRLAASIAQNERRLPILRQHLDDVNDRANRGATFGQQFGQSFNQSLMGILGPAALATAAVGGIFKAIEGGRAAGQEALALREQQNALRAVTGGLEGYGEAMATAREQQALFGGSLRENIEGIQGLAITAKETGADLNALVDLSQRLVLKSPEQGAGGSRIALVEALSEGNLASIARRFEIPRAAIKALGDETLPVGERLQALNDYLNKIGITSEAAAGRVDQSALAYRGLAQEWETLATAAGGGLADGFSRAATGLDRLLGLINGNPKALAELKALPMFGGNGVAVVGDAEQAAADAARRAAGALASEQLGGTRGGRLMAEKIGGLENLHIAREQLTELNIAGGVAQQQAARLTEEWRAGRLASEDYRNGLAALMAGLRDSVDVEDRRAGAIHNAAEATKELTDEERERLEGRAEQTNERAAEAFERLQTAQADYARESAQRLGDHQRKLADIQADGAARLLEIDTRYQTQRADADRAYLDKRADIQADLARKLADLDKDYANDTAQRRAEAAERLEQLEATLADRILDLRRAAAERIAELEDDAGTQAEERREAQAEREREAAERRATIAQSLATRLADFDAQQLERRSAAQEQYQDRLVSLAEQFADREQQAQKAAEDRQQAYQDRLADAAEDSADKAEDRAQRHADRLEDIRRKSEGNQQGRITRLTGETFTTEFAGSADNSDTARLLAEEEERFRIEEERARRDEERARERMERDRQRQEEDAAERLAEQAQQYQEQLIAADAAYAEQEAKAEEKAARDRARLEAQGAEQLAAFEAQTLRQEEQAAKQEAMEDERRERQIEKIRAQLAIQEADVVADAEKQRARLAEDLESDLATRDAAYQERRAKAQEDATLALADAEAAYIAQLTKLQESHAAQRAEAELATTARIEQEADGFARQEEQRAAAYARQQEQLKTALGEQLAEYTRIQVELGNITESEGARRTKILEAEYLAQAKAQKDAYDSFFGTVFGGMADTSYDAVEDTRSRRTVANPGGGIVIQSLTVNGVQDARTLLAEIRREAINEVRANGGDVSEYWGGERDG